MPYAIPLMNTHDVRARLTMDIKQVPFAFAEFTVRVRQYIDRYVDALCVMCAKYSADHDSFIGVIKFTTHLLQIRSLLTLE